MMKFEDFKASFPYRGKSVYARLFALHGDNIKTKKEKFAVNNLEKIFKATFKISSKIGFHEMSLRELCSETELSMGGIYSCIESKEMIAIMVKDMVKMVSSDIIDNALRYKNRKHALEEIVTHHILPQKYYIHGFIFSTLKLALYLPVIKKIPRLLS